MFKKVKALLEEKIILTGVTLRDISFFISGLIFCWVVFWFAFTEPKKITAPGVSAMTSILTLLFAIYSAFKIKEWVDIKANDKAFDLIDELIGKIVKVKSELCHARSEFNAIFKDFGEHEKKYDKINKELKRFIEHCQAGQKECVDSILIAESFTTWGYKLEGEVNGSIGVLLKGIINYNQAATGYYNFMAASDDLQDSDIENFKNELEERFDFVRDTYENLLSRNFRNYFSKIKQ